MMKNTSMRGWRMCLALASAMALSTGGHANGDAPCADSAEPNAGGVYACATTSQSFNVTSSASGSNSALSLTLELTTGSADIGAAGNIYLGANLPNGTWFLHNGSGWVPYSGGALPALYSGSLPSTRSQVVLSQTDVRSLAGVNIYFGYGRSDTDMLSRGLVKLAYTIPAASTNVGSADEVRRLLDDTLGITRILFAGGGLTQQLTPVIQALFSSTPSTCPVVTTNLTGGLDLSSLSSLPNPTIATINYGSGCVASDGSTKSGKTTISISNLSMTSSQMSASFVLTMNQARSNGALLGDGTISGSISGLSLASNAMSVGNSNFSFSNFTLPNGKVVTGTATLSMPSATSFSATLNMNATDLSISLPLSGSVASNVYTLNSSGGTINGYTTVFNAVKYDTASCPGMPIGGSIAFSKGGQTYTAVFSNTCSSSFTVR